MKALKIVTAVSFLLVASLSAASSLFAASDVAEDSVVVAKFQNEKELFTKLERGLIYNLNSNVKGVVESSLYNAINYKIAYPEFDSQKVKELISRIALEGESHSLRYKAYLTLAYYKHPSQFDSPEALLSMLDYKHQDGIFFYLQDKVQTEQFTSNIN
ncbi:hypothetical protein [Rhodohalobacter sp. 614A]|uniref:hypothetical protein n=1 Tax=Rhodohalobacter sp. 614A TaxID=2908649 RepID=UPI001F24E853|nr:hypothetical protein [Rhodohalobacter sp. 614A]